MFVVCTGKGLRAAGFESEIVQTGDKALTRLAGPVPSMVVLDLKLPGVPGEDILTICVEPS